MEKITHELAESTCLTKLVGNSSYLYIVLDYGSSLLMTFNSPLGRFRFICLPWGLACAQDIFQWMMDQILTHCDGVIGIIDDVVVHGKDDKEHDKHLYKFMRVACEHGLVFNKDKCAVKQTSVAFFRCVHDANETHPDPEKVSAFHKMPAPETATQLQKFLRLVTYLSPFITSSSSFTAPLHGLLKKGTEFSGTTPIRKHLIKPNQWFARIPHCGTLMSANLSLSKLIHPTKAYVLPSFKMAAQLPLLPKLLHLWSSIMPT